MCQGNTQQRSESVTQLSGPKTYWFVRIKMETASLHRKDSWFELLFICNRSNLLFFTLLSNGEIALCWGLSQTGWPLTWTPACFLLLIQTGRFLYSSTHPCRRKTKKQQNAGYCHEAVHLPGNISGKCAMHACFRKISFNILNLFTSFPSAVYFT